MTCPRRNDGWPCVMTMIGGRCCPKDHEDCSQPVYQCICCGGHDYGDPGGPAHRECFEECKR